MLWTHYRARVAGLSRDRAPDDPDLLDARRCLATERLAEEIRRTLSKQPDLLPEQRDRLAGMIAAGPVGAA